MLIWFEALESGSENGVKLSGGRHALPWHEVLSGRLHRLLILDEGHEWLPLTLDGWRPCYRKNSELDSVLTEKTRTLLLAQIS